MINRHCANCGKQLYGFELDDMIEAELDYRRDFPHTWDRGGRVLVCDTCFKQLADDDPPQEWDARQFEE